MYLSTWSCQHTCFRYFGCIYWQTEPPNEYLKETIHSSHFSVKNQGCVIKNSHSSFSQYFRQGRPLNQVILMVILTEKGKIKSIASRVRSNSFYWAFEAVDPRLWPEQLNGSPLTSAYCTVAYRHGTMPARLDLAHDWQVNIINI